MNDKFQITKEQYLEARLIIATVEANMWWEQNNTQDRPVQRQTSESDFLTFREAQKHVKFGETKFRELMAEEKLPRPHHVEGKNLWLKPELDKALSKLVKTGKQKNGNDQQVRRRPKAD